MGVRKHLVFQFLPEDRAQIAAALGAHPAIGPAEAEGALVRYHVAAGDSTCLVELGSDHGAVVFTPGDGDAAASLAQDVLTESGAVFAGCC
ncbi:MAG: hypothetical protein HY321_16605 [Armatimonadetes bacterium]|nr:hypothetical protein [Armatimonadota bacterium]